MLDSACAELSQLNPYRYRGYYYDTETGLYFLKTRYYDPEVGRFITIDGLPMLSAKTLNGLNLYAYCANNPIMAIDPQGTSFWSWVKKAWSNVKSVAIKAGKLVAGAALMAGGLAFTWATLPLAMGLRGAGFLTQAGASMFMYGGFMAASVFNSEVNANMQAIGWNPFNTDIDAVLDAGRVSFYKGVPVIRANVERSGTFLAIVLQRNTVENTLRHEWGHTIQQGIVGPLRFLTTIAITSSAQLGKNKWPDNLYYERPWEITADIFGGATRLHDQYDINVGWGYLATVTFAWLFSYFFLC